MFEKIEKPPQCLANKLKSGNYYTKAKGNDIFIFFEKIFQTIISEQRVAREWEKNQKSFLKC